jgi:hypothetical protein
MWEQLLTMISGRPKYSESVVSLCLLGVIVLITAGVLVKQSDYEMSQFGMDTVVAGLSEKNSEIIEKIAPAFLSTPDMEKLSAPEVYDSHSLYEKINGKAPIYLESGFRQLVTQRLVNKKNSKLWAELFIYDMGSVANAYSVYSRQKRPSAKILPGTGFACESENALFLSYGQYYIEFIGSTDTQELLEAMRQIVWQIRNSKTVGNIEISQIKLFSEEKLISDSIKLYLTNTFGFEGLADVFTGQYQIGNDIVTAFLSERISAEQAMRLSQQYHRFLLDNGGTDLSTADAKMKIVDFYDTIEIISVAGRYLFGIHEADDRQAAEKLAASFSKKLNEQ